MYVLGTNPQEKTETTRLYINRKGIKDAPPPLSLGGISRLVDDICANSDNKSDPVDSIQSETTLQPGRRAEITGVRGRFEGRNPLGLGSDGSPDTRTTDVGGRGRINFQKEGEGRSRQGTQSVGVEGEKMGRRDEERRG